MIRQKRYEKQRRDGAKTFLFYLFLAHNIKVDENEKKTILL